MSYPQPAASLAVTAGLDAYRLITPIGPGDIYEIDASAKAIVLGPNSDVSRLLVTYYDDLIGGANTAIVSPSRSFVNQVNARLDQPYPGTGKKGRILVSIDDLYFPTITLAPPSVIDVVQPKIDLLVYFTEAPSVVPQRSDGLWHFENFKSTGGGFGDSFMVIPYWGRKYASVTIQNLITGGPNLFYALSGLNFTTSGASLVLIDTVAALAANATHESIVRASVNGMFDALYIDFQPAGGAGIVGPLPTKIVTSDSPL